MQKSSFFPNFALAMIQEIQIRILPEQAANEQGIKQFLTDEKGLDARRITHIRILKRSIDARQRTIYVNLTVRIYMDEEPTDQPFTPIEYHDVSSKPAAIVVGAGPGGLFAALRLIELGIRPIVLERGKDVHERRKDIARISREHVVNPESNFSFGEGGAGAFSDGKLYTRSKKRGNVDRILQIFCQHGASESILVDAHPHIGTDKLPRVIENMRSTIIRCGGEVHFQTKVTDLLINNNKVYGVNAIDSSEATAKTLQFEGPVILATGHSARDVYRWLYQNKVEIESKNLAVGVRLEHPAHLIDQIQYHRKEGKGQYLPTAEYSFVTQVEGRGVYSFCMCPGGTVVPAASGPEQIVVNGMSPSLRNSPWSNSGMVVELHLEDIMSFSSQLSTLNYQLSTINSQQSCRHRFLNHPTNQASSLPHSTSGCHHSSPSVSSKDSASLVDRVTDSLPTKPSSLVWKHVHPRLSASFATPKHCNTFASKVCSPAAKEPAMQGGLYLQVLMENVVQKI